MKLLKIREKMQSIYAKYSKYIDFGTKFLLAVFTFFMIDQSIGTMEQLSSPMILLGASGLCAFFTPVVIVVVAMGLMLVHMVNISIGSAAVMLVLFLVMFLLYCRFTPERAIVVLLVPVAFMLKVPYVIPILCGLSLTPISAIPVVFGTIVHYSLVEFSGMTKELAESEDLMAHITLFFKEIVQNKELWIMAAAFTVAVTMVYLIKRLAISYAREIAILSGSVVHIIIIIFMGNIFKTSISIVAVIGGNTVAFILAYLIYTLLFAADYRRIETIQYEDDDYYYYVKAVPKKKLTLPIEPLVQDMPEVEEEKDEIIN